MMKTRVAIAAAAIAALSTVPATAAQALDRDCRIMGPEYVAETIDCALYIVETAIG